MPVVSDILKRITRSNMDLTRIGKINKNGSYFGVPGLTQYEGGVNYSLKKAKVANTTDVDISNNLIEETLKNKNLLPDDIKRLIDARNSSYIDYTLFDETGMAQAAKRLKLDAVLLHENQDFPGSPSSVFVTNIQKLIRK